MFRGSNSDLAWVLGRALVVARDLGSPSCGSEHLLIALSELSGGVSTVLRRSGVSAFAVREAVVQAGPLGAGAAADRDLLAPLGVDLDALLSPLGRSVLDRPPGRRPLFPLGGASARQRCAQLSPPLSLDARAAYEASLRLALARRDREHRAEHLALTLLALDPGTRWVLRRIGVDAEGLLAELARVFPSPKRMVLLSADRRVGRRARCNDILRRYQCATGRTPAMGGAIAQLLVG